MDVVHGVAGLKRAHGRLFVVVGVFDGLHRGHHYLLARLREAARSHGARPAVITFDAHPDEIVLGHAPPLLLDPEERLARLAAAGVEVTVVQHFDAELRMTEYDVFVASIAERAGLAGFLMTPDAAFGHDRRGTPTTLAELGARMGFEVAVVPPFSLEGRPVRSRAIREAIAEGDLATARHLLGRPMAVTGDLVEGAMTFPIPVALPPEGTYRVTVEPAWTAEGRSAAPRRSAVTVAGDHVELLGAGSGPDPRARVAFGPRLPEEGNPAILRRSQKKTSK
jgi:FAD synthase